MTTSIPYINDGKIRIESFELKTCLSRQQFILHCTYNKTIGFFFEIEKKTT